MRSFNTAGPCVAERHYLLPPEPRLAKARKLVEGSFYFVVHGPPRTGKTTAVATLAHTLTDEGRYAALHFSCRDGGAAGEDYDAAERTVIESIQRAAAEMLPAELRPPDRWRDASDGLLLAWFLTAWAKRCPLPVVLFFDDVDALHSRALISVRSTLRASYTHRPRAFPASVALCGRQDVSQPYVVDSVVPYNVVPYNISRDSLRLNDFTPAEVRALCAQHTAATGQVFRDEALERVYAHSQGQPWLVNALAQAAIDEVGIDEVGIGESMPIGAEHIDDARERLIEARSGVLGLLAARLAEDRVRGVIEPMIAGGAVLGRPLCNDLDYARDLGLLAPTKPAVIANPIYREAIVRILCADLEAKFDIDPCGFAALVSADGRLDVARVLAQFAALWRGHGEALVNGVTYAQVAPYLVFVAFLRRAVFLVGGRVDPDYGMLRRRLDLMLRCPYPDKAGVLWQQEMVQLKAWQPSQPDPIDEGLGQLDEHLNRLGLDRLGLESPTRWR